MFEALNANKLNTDDEIKGPYIAGHRIGQKIFLCKESRWWHTCIDCDGVSIEKC